MPSLLRMPAVSANMTEAVLQDWTVAERTPFAADQPLVTVETEKAVVDVEAESDGVILRTLVAAGSRVEVGAPIALLGEPGEQVDDLDAALAELGVAPGSNGPGAGAPEPPRTPDDPEGGTANTGDGGVSRVPAAQKPATSNGDRPHRIFASPLARRLAREAGLPVGEIRGTGPRGRILRRDVEAAVSERSTAAAGSRVEAVSPVEAAGPGREKAAAAPYREIPHSQVRRATATRLVESKQTTPHFYVRATLDARRLLWLRAELNDGAEAKISLNDLLVKAVAWTHTLVPEMNVTWTEDAVRQYSAVDVSVAVATERGLLTPVLRGVDSMSVSAVAAATTDLAERARSGRLRQDELEGGSITVTNLGMFGTEEFGAIINPPQAAILAVGAVRDEPVARKGKLRVRPVIRVTLSADHRPVDGVLAARWMRELVALVERPLRILA